MMDTRCPRVGLSHVTVTRCQVQSSRCIQSLLAEPRISAKAFSVSAPSVCNSLVAAVILLWIFLVFQQF